MKFVQFAGLWTLVNHPTRERDWSLEQKFRAIKAAGFGGVCARLDTVTARLARRHSLFAIGQIFPEIPAEFEALLRAQKMAGASQVNVQLGSHDTTAKEAVRKWIRLEQVADGLEIAVSLETHRDSVSESPEKLFELADRYQNETGRLLRLTWDFSHFAIAKHLHPGEWAERLLTRPELVQHAAQFLFRPFNAHHAQLPVTRQKKLTPETLDYLDFAQEVMRLWKAAAGNRERTLLACPELGPLGGYALSGFPPVWPDAIVLSRELAKRWDKARP
jgi:hypothetical protein